MNRYVKKPIAIEAVKWKGFNNDEIKDFAGDSVNIGGYPEAYDMGLHGMFRYVRIWNYAKNFDLDKFVPDT